MHAHNTGWDNRSAEQWLDQAARFEKMARRLDHHPQLNASFSALAQDARKRAKYGPITSQDYGLSSIGLQAGTPAIESDLDYFRSRAANEKAAANQAHDIRVRRVHLEMAERYRILIRATEAGSGARLRLML
jgi:hypothetical protein